MAEAAIATVVAIGTKVAAAYASSALVAAAINTAVMYGLNKVVSNQNKPRSQGQVITLAINPDEPRRLQVGKRLNAGVLVDWYVKGSKNNQLFMVIYLGEGPMGQVARVFSGGRPVHSTPLVHATRTVIPGFRSTEGGAAGERLWITYYDGRPGQGADGYLSGQGVGWDSNYIGTGCAYAIVECLWDSDNLRTPPSLAFEMEGAKFYDRRLDTTAGGSGSHRIDNPATWALNDNPAVALDHYLLGRYLGDIKVFGVGLDPDDVPYARQAALANLCDEDVTLKAGGTQKRYRANGFLFADRTYADTIRDLCRAMNARPADFGGRIGIIDSEERTPVLTIYDGDVIESVAEQYSPKRSWGELVSVVRGTYQSPAQNYQAAEYPRVTKTAWVTADGGSPKEATLDLEMETDPERAQRLATLYAVRERRQAQLTGTYGLRTIELEQGDWFIRSGGIFGEEGKVFEVIDRALDVASMTVTLTAFEVDPADSAWDETEAADPPPDPISSDDLLQAMEAPDLTVTGITLAGTAAQLPAIKIEWVVPTDPRALQIVVEAIPEAGGVPTSAVADVGVGEIVFTNGITDDTDYLVRARFIGNFTPSEWTDTFEVTTLGDYSVGVASSVPWAGLTGAIPATVDNAQVAYGANALTNTEFNYSTAHPPVGWDNGWNGTAATTIQRDYNPALDDVKVARAVALGTPAAGTVFDNLNSGAASRLPVRPGDMVCGSALVECLGSAPSAQTTVAILFRTQNGSYISETHGAIISNANFPLDSVAKFQRATVFATAPANAAYAELFQRAYCNGGAFPAVYMLRPMLALVRAGTTAAPEYSPGVAYRQADPTIENTAAAITNQGLLALGNYYSQSTDPGSVSNGSLWFQTSTNNLYIRNDGTWGLIGKVTQGGLGRNSYSNLLTSGTTWITLGTFDMTVAASGFLDFRLTKFTVNSASTLSGGTTFNGNWRITEATQAAPSTKTVVYSGTFSVEVLPPAAMLWNNQPNDVVANTKSGPCRYTFEVQRASGTNNIATGGLTGSLTGGWTPAAS